jgi:glycosyltransferase involved in cell wall biosynthesis
VKILLPIDRIGDAGIGTVTRDLCRLLPEVLPEGDRLLTLGGRPPCSTAPSVTHIATRRPPVNRLLRFMHEQAVLARAARRADLVHLLDHRSVLASRRPFLLTVHDLFFLDRPEWYPRTVGLYKTVMMHASLAMGPAAIVCVSEFTRDRLRHHFPGVDATPVRVIHPGVEPEDAPRTTDPESGFFLTVSTVEPRKNHLTLLRAFQAARAQGLRLRWKVVGAPGYSSAEAMAALRSSPGVDLEGLVADGERERLYRQALFVAMPSHAEGFGFPPLEAMARGIATVCSSGSALDETAGDGALRVAPTDVDGWAEALLRLESDAALREALRGRGLARVSSFDPRLSARRHAAIYRDVLAA